MAGHGVVGFFGLVGGTVTIENERARRWRCVLIGDLE